VVNSENFKNPKNQLICYQDSDSLNWSQKEIIHFYFNQWLETGMERFDFI